MRPHSLDALFVPLSRLSGVGPKLGKLLQRLFAKPDPLLVDAVLHLPSSVIDMRHISQVKDLQPDTTATVQVTATRHRSPARGSRAPYRVEVQDSTGPLTLQWFRGESAYLQKLLIPGDTYFVSGKVEMWDGQSRMTHPERIATPEKFASMPRIEAIYPATEGLTQSALRRVMATSLSRLPALPEWCHLDVQARHKLPDFCTSLRMLHLPDTPDMLSPLSPAWQRLAYDELVSYQLALGLVRRRIQRSTGLARRGTGERRQSIASALPFELTTGQQEAIDEIIKDLETPQRMIRLLQGDVGSGKTLVALMAMAHVAESGAQSALMAPTEILSRQHFERLQPLARAAGLECILITGREKGKERSRITTQIAQGQSHIVIGTHALFQSDVVFHNLGLAVIDEQHRFGVHQRLALAQKGEAVDVLVMTATPIPRTLVLTCYGDMEVSTLREKPAGRQPIDTRMVSMERIKDVLEGLRRAFDSGRRAYWICPLVSESETLDLTAAEERHAMLRQHFGYRVGIVHGKMKGNEKDAAMRAFAQGETQILVATTVVEVGVDVPEASIMIIDHAERFGLSQLHQLRGRIGRGSQRSSCILLYATPLGQTARARLMVLRDTEDGFRIAEEDLRLRGEGDILGTRQSGMPDFHVFRPEFHQSLMQTARDDAKLVLATDPDLVSERGQALRLLLYIFGRTDALRLLSAG